jgi:hypothetical protein
MLVLQPMTTEHPSEIFEVSSLVHHYVREALVPFSKEEMTL